jgi:hypothetical protein
MIVLFLCCAIEQNAGRHKNAADDKGECTLKEGNVTNQGYTVIFRETICN